ncbi:protein of unknown function [Legionella hackeliae]|uniref:Uncharacterized protein n=1 Tax=Legionella hackeliae TaxID=449 RepID=A0A0A8UXW8_LEGHA|nr:protein of unknown function [Legionella hackeliae]
MWHYKTNPAYPSIARRLGSFDFEPPEMFFPTVQAFNRARKATTYRLSKELFFFTPDQKNSPRILAGIAVNEEPEEVSCIKNQ